MADEVVIRIRAQNLTKKEFDAAQRQLNKIGREAGVLGKQTKIAGVSITSLGRSFAQGASSALGLGAAVGGATVAIQGLVLGLRQSVQSAISFDDSMTRIETLVGINREQVNAWRQDLLDLAPALGKSPQELADALFFITSAGIQGADALDTLKISAQASALGLGETKTVADAVTSVMNAYGKENINAAEATRILVGTVREGKAEADSIAGSLGRVIPVANQLGVSFADVGSFIAATTRVGLSAEEAVTALRGALTTLTNPTKEQTDALADLAARGLLPANFALADIRKTIRENGLGEAFVQLTQATKGNEEAMTALIGNVRASTGVLAAYGKQAESTLEIQERLRTDTGEFGRAVERLEETTGQKLREVEAAWVSLKVSIGTSIADALRFWSDFGDGVSDVADRTVGRILSFAGEVDRAMTIVDIALAGPENREKILADIAKGQAVFTGATSKQLQVFREFQKQQQANTETTEENSEATSENAAAIEVDTDALERQRKETEKARKAAEEYAKFLKELTTNAFAAAEAITRASVAQIEFNEGIRDAISEDLEFNIPDVIPSANVGGAVEGFELTAIGEIPGIVAGIGDIEDATEKARQRQEEYDEALERAANLVTLIPGPLGQIVGQTIAAAQAMSQLSSNAGGFFGGFKDLFSGGLLSSISNVAGLAGIGISIGTAIFSGLKSLFGGGPDIGRDVGRDLGASISEELEKQIRDSGQNIQLAINDIFREGGFATIDRFTEEVADLFSSLERGEISEPEFLKTIGESVPILRENIREMGEEGVFQLERIFGAAAATGTAFEGMDELARLYVERARELGIEINNVALETLGLGEAMQSSFAPDTLETFAEKLGITTEEARELANELGLNMQTNLERLAAEAGLTVEQFQALQAALGEKLGKDLNAEELAAFLESTGASAAGLAESLGITVEAGEGLAEGQAAANEEISAGVGLANSLALALERAARASGGIHIPSTSGTSAEAIGMAHGGFGETTRPTLFRTSERGQREGFAFFPGGLPRGGGGDVVLNAQIAVTVAPRALTKGAARELVDDLVPELGEALDNQLRGRLQKSLQESGFRRSLT